MELQNSDATESSSCSCTFLGVLKNPKTECAPPLWRGAVVLKSQIVGVQGHLNLKKLRKPHKAESPLRSDKLSHSKTPFQHALFSVEGKSVYTEKKEKRFEKKLHGS
jgi:hypothetical protein